MNPPTSTTTSAVLVFGDASLHGTYSLPAPATRHGVFRSSSPPEAFDGPLRAGPLGDLNGDGLADFLLGADPGPGGRLYLVFGSRGPRGRSRPGKRSGLPRLPGIEILSTSPTAARSAARGRRSAMWMATARRTSRSAIPSTAPWKPNRGHDSSSSAARSLPARVDLAETGTSLRGCTDPRGRGPVLPRVRSGRRGRRQCDGRGRLLVSVRQNSQVVGPIADRGTTGPGARRVAGGASSTGDLGRFRGGPGSRGSGRHRPELVERQPSLPPAT